MDAIQKIQKGPPPESDPTKIIATRPPELRPLWAPRVSAMDGPQLTTLW